MVLAHIDTLIIYGRSDVCTIRKLKLEIHTISVYLWTNRNDVNNNNNNKNENKTNKSASKDSRTTRKYRFNNDKVSKVEQLFCSCGVSLSHRSSFEVFCNDSSKYNTRA